MTASAQPLPARSTSSGTLPADTTASVQRLRRYAWWLDSSIRIPGTQRRIGLEGLLGLIPGVGDLAGLLLSILVIVGGVRLGVSAGTVGRMALNIGLEALVGAVPVLGDLFDLAFKANQRNVELIARSLEQPEETRRSSRLVMAGVLGGSAATLIALGWGLIALVQAVF